MLHARDEVLYLVVLHAAQTTLCLLQPITQLRVFAAECPPLLQLVADSLLPQAKLVLEVRTA